MQWSMIAGLLLAWAAEAPSQLAPVQMREEPLAIPTYLMGPAETNPIFRVPYRYQGAEGRVYPYPFQGKLADDKQTVSYKSVFLENEFVKISVLPELGGRLYLAQDKTTGYDFIYRNKVIKPALIGMAGAWCSGGVEWNIPHHHRVTGHMPVDHRLIEHPDGSRTVWVGEYEKRHGMKWLTGLTLRPGQSFVEVEFRMLNVTPLFHSFLCFANLAVHANEQYQVIFPPDVQRAVYHSKTEFVDWPIARSIYQGADFRSGVDVSWWKNTLSPTSFFAWGTRQDFLAGIDHGKGFGTVLIGDHHTCPGKKMWNWGNNDVARLWDQMLTDEDGPYIELMMGAFSDNQPDYSWIGPFAERRATMYYYGCRGLAGIKAASRDFALNLDLQADQARVQLNATARRDNLSLILTTDGKELAREPITLSPNSPITKDFPLPAGTKPETVRVVVADSTGKELIAYQPQPQGKEPAPDTYHDPAPPSQIATVEELLLRGQRLEQFYNPQFSPLPYYLEALRREPQNAQANTLLGIHSLKRMRFEEAIGHLKTACDRLTSNHTRPRDGEPHFYLGVALLMAGKPDESYEQLARASWSDEFMGPSYFLMARIDCQRGDFDRALGHLDDARRAGPLNVEALNLRTILLRHLDRKAAAEAAATAALDADPLNTLALHELSLLKTGNHGTQDWLTLTGDPRENLLQVAARYADAGFPRDAADLLDSLAGGEPPSPRADALISYHSGLYTLEAGDPARAAQLFNQAAQSNTQSCFPHGLSSLRALEAALRVNPDNPSAHLLLGNLICDNLPESAQKHWRRTLELDPANPLAHRNLAFVLANAFDRVDEAVPLIQQAIKLKPDDPLYLVEADKYLKKAKASPEQRLQLLLSHQDTCARDDDATARLVGLLIATAQYDQAIDILRQRHFHSQERFDQNIHVLWVDAHILRGRARLEAGKIAEALADFQSSLEFPRNLEIARDSKAVWARYWLGLARSQQGSQPESKREFQLMTESSHLGTWAGEEWPEVAYARALAHQSLGEADKASQAFTRMENSGRHLLDDKTHEAAMLESVDRRQEESDRRSRGHVLLGLAMLGKNDNEQAAAQFDQARKLDPGLFGPGSPLSAIIQDGLKTKR